MAIESLADAQTALEKHRKLAEQAAELMKKHGITKKLEEAAKLKAEATEWAIENDADQIELKGAHATLVRQMFGGRWIGDADEITDNDPKSAVSLRELLEKKFKSDIETKGSKARKAWLKITRRIVDPVLIDAAVAEGVFKREDIEDAYVEREKAPYLRVFKDE